MTTAPAPRAPDLLERRLVQGKLAFTFRVSPLANLAYQLDCLAEVIHCSLPAYKELWASRLTPEDDAPLAAWRAVRRAYDTNVDLGAPESTAKAALPIPFEGLEYGKQLRIASFVARTPDDYARSLAVLARPADASRLLAAMAHFRPRFEKWWTSGGRALAQAFYDGIVRLFERGQLGGIVDRAARFYGAELPDPAEVAFELIVRPKSVSRTTSAEQVMDHSVIEVVENEPPEERIDVITHELFHFFFASRTGEKKAKLIERFASAADPLAIVGYYLLDESLATTFGNGLVGRTFEPEKFARRIGRDNSLYDNRGIDRTAKALLPHVDEILARSLDGPELVPLLLRAVHEAIGDVPPPVEYVHSLAILFDAAFTRAKERLEREAHTNHVYSSSPLAEVASVEIFKAHPALSSAIMLGAADLDRLASYLPASELRLVREQAKGGAPFVHAWPRTPHAYVFVFVAAEPAAMEKLVSAFCARTTPLRGRETWQPP